MKTLSKLTYTSCVLAMFASMQINAEEISLFHRWPNEPRKSFIQERVDQFEKDNPGVTVKVDQVINDTYKDKLKVILGSSNAPDVYFSWSGEFGNNIARNGAAMDLTELYQNDPDVFDDIIETQVAPFIYDGKVYGLPWSMNGKALFYNMEILNENNIEIPQTLDEFFAACKVLKDKNITPLAFSSKEHWAISHWVGTLNERIVAPDVIKADYERSSGGFTDPAYIQSLNTLKKIVDECANKFTNSIDHATERNMFLAGKAAMDFLEFGEIRYLLVDADFDFASSNFPVVTDGAGNQSTMQGAPEGYMISSKTAHPELAYKLLKEIVAGTGANSLTEVTGELSTVKGAVASSNAPESQKNAATQIEEAQGMHLWLDNAIDFQIVTEYMNGVQLMLDGKLTPEEVMANVHKEAVVVKNSL